MIIEEKMAVDFWRKGANGYAISQFQGHKYFLQYLCILFNKKLQKAYKAAKQIHRLSFPAYLLHKGHNFYFLIGCIPLPVIYNERKV